jgi:hypothetical protein
MSTPLEKPPGPIDLSAYALQRTRARAVAEQYPSATDDHPPLSPYAPKRTRERGGPGQEVRTAIDDDAPDICPSDARDGGEDAPKLAFERGAEFSVDPESAVPLQPAPEPESGRHVTRAAEPPEASANDYDLDRLEASLRWLQRQEAATRLARANQPPPRRTSTLLDARDRRLSGERFGERFGSPISLEPERLTPPAPPRRNLRAPLGILVASMLAASAIYYFFVAGWAPSSTPGPAPQMASVGSRAAAPTSLSSHKPERPPVVARGDDAAASPQHEPFSQPTALPPPARSSEGDALAMLQPVTPSAEAMSPREADRTLDPAEIELLMQQGEQFIVAGDVVTARIVFQRAAQAHDATAALALAATYDPIVLSKLGVVGMNADVEKARTWYQKAESLGSADAARRLRALANR